MTSRSDGGGKFTPSSMYSPAKLVAGQRLQPKQHKTFTTFDLNDCDG